MAKFEITTPGGARYEIEAPDNASDAQVAEVIRHQFGGGQPKQKHDAYKDWTTYGKDLARTTLGQGGGLGFGDELIAGVRSAFGGTPYKQALQEERDAVARFKDQNPGTAMAGELVGGLATPMLGAGRFIAGGANLLGRTARSAMVGSGVGAVNAVGTQEGNDFETYKNSAMGGAMVGGAVGAAIPSAVAMVQRGFQGARNMAQMRADDEGSARLYFADRLRANNLTEQDLAADLARGNQARQFAGGQAELPEAIADVSPVTQRVLRGIKVGGSADDIIEPALGQRQAGNIDFRRGAESSGQSSRLREDMRLSMRVTDQELADQTANLSGRRKQEADRLFSQARANSEPFDLSPTLQRYAYEAMNLPDPAQRSVVNRAVEYFTQQGRSNGANPGFPVTDVDRFHKAKMALDDLLGLQSIREQGNLHRLLTSMKHDLTDDVFKFGADGSATINRTYREALDRFASRSAQINAAELGRAFARGTETITPRMWRAMPEAEKSMVRKAYIEDTARGMGRKAAGPTSDFTGPLRTGNAGEDLRMMLPPTAGRSPEFPGGNRERLGELVSREQRISDTARKVLGNSSTAEKAADAIDIGRLARVTRYIRTEGGITQAAMASLSDALERMSAIKGEKARYLAQQLLTADPAQQDAFLQQVAAEYGRSQLPRITAAINRWSYRIENSAAGYPSRDEGRRATFETRRANAPRGLIGLGSATR